MEKFAKVAKKRNSRRKSNNKQSVATDARKRTLFVEEKDKRNVTKRENRNAVSDRKRKRTVRKTASPLVGDIGEKAEH